MTKKMFFLAAICNNFHSKKWYKSKKSTIKVNFLLALFLLFFTGYAFAEQVEMRIANFITYEGYGSAVFKDELVGYDDNTSISIQSSNFNLASFNYTVHNLSANQIYEATVYVKGENLVVENNGEWGTSIHASTWTGWVTSTLNTSGSYDWRKIRFVFRTTDFGNATLCLCLGSVYDKAKGKVYFDNLEIKPFAEKQFNGGKIRLDFDSEDVIISDSKTQAYANKLGEVYAKYEELTGYTPYSGTTIDIIFSDYHNYYGLAGNPISIDKRFAKNILTKFNTKNDYDFGVLHEIGHDFDHDKWNFDAEFWANTKMAYVLEQLNLSVDIDGIKTGAEIKNYYKQSYDNELVQGRWSHDGLTYIFLQIKDEYGWNIFKEAFRSTLPVNGCKFEHFIYLLEIASGANIRQEFFSNRIWELAVNEYGCPNTHTINVSANPSAGGTVSGGGTYTSNASCSVKATANSGYIFTNWTKNGSEISTDANFQFTVTENRTLVANFTQRPTCKTPPEYDEILTPPTNSWENRSVSLQPNSCHVFRVSVTSGVKYYFNTDPQGTQSFNAKLYLYNNSGTQLVSSDTDDSGERIAYRFNYTGDAYVKVNGNSSYAGNFWFSYRIVSDDADLSSLTVSQGTLSPAFNANTTSYTVDVANDVTSITISATANSNAIAVSGDGTKTLEVGGNPFEIIVTAESGAQKTYTVVVNRDNPTSTSPDLQLVSLDVNGDLYQNQTGSFTATLKNNGNAAYNSSLWFYLEKPVTYSPNQWIGGNVYFIAAGETKTITFTGTVTLPPGTYNCNMVYDANNNPSDIATVQFGSHPDVQATVNSVTVTDYSPYRESKHFIFDIPTSFLTGNITPENLGRWMQHMDDVYGAYTDLVRHTPCDGQKLTFVASEDGYGALWVYGGNPYIYWNVDVIANSFKEINDYDSWSFGPMHEIGHLFDKEPEPNWFFHAEITANLKAIYALDVLPDCKYERDGYRYSLQDMYDYFYNWSVQDDGDDDRYTDKITLAFINVARQYGWEVFTKTFNSYWNNSYPYTNCYIGNGASKYNDFVDRLEYFSGSEDIRSECFSVNNWLAAIEKHYPRIYSQSGTCGANLTWTLNCGTLTISGNGAMPNYTSGSAPWNDNSENIKAIIIQDGVTSIGNEAFKWYSNLKTVTIGNSVTSIGQDAFYACNGLTSLILPNSVKTIGYGSFAACSSLTSVIIPNSVISIDHYGFSGCAGLTSITIPANITSIGSYAFSNCTGLKSVTNLATIPQSINSSVFENVNIGNIPLTVPAESIELYIVANVWKDFFFCTNTITASVEGGNGSISPSGPQSIACGSSKTFTFIPNSGYEINQVLVDGVNNTSAVSTGSYTFENVTANHIISVTFKAIAVTTYTINISSSPSSGGTVSGNGSYASGSSCTVSATENSGYTFTNWTENDSEVSTTENYTFTVSANRNLVANFTANIVPPTVITNAATNITQTSATLNKTVTAGTATITMQGFKYKKTSENTWSTSTTGNLTGLASGIQYQFYAYATTTSDMVTGDTLIFTSLDATAIETIDAPKLTIYPNPAKDEIFIQSEQLIEKIEISDMAGRVVVLTNSTTIHISHLPQGIYFVKIFIDCQSIVRKIIKK